MMRFVLFFFAYLSLSFAVAQSPLQKAIDKLAEDPDLKHAGLGICVIDVESGKVIAQHDKDQSLIPASSLKVVTTATALFKLGEGFRFKTELQYDGKLEKDGTLNGNLYIKGFGDPTLGSDRFDKAMSAEKLMAEFVQAIKKAGIKKINGKIVGDASFFTSEVNGRSWLWEDLGNYYASGAWGLNILENKYYLNIRQNPKLGELTKIEGTKPSIPNLLLINEVRSAEVNSGDNAYVFGSPYSYTRFVRGTIPIGKGIFTIKGSIPDPPFFAAYLLMQALENGGISTSKRATSQFELERLGKTKTTRKTIHSHLSPTLKEIVIETNLESVNLYCESMLRYLSVTKADNRNVESGLKLIYNFWKEKGLDTEGFFMEDGSGLSPFNNVSAFHLAKIMQLIAKDQKFYQSFKESLPIAGLSGTLKYMLRGTAAENNLIAKSGGMKRVRSYTGFARMKSGKLVSFSIIANHFSCKSNIMRRKMEKIMVELCH
jgi:serine-type D-Ala-D-Ala carboxypeptidase/endopeptidase (penicillin-binding protein 4)